MPLQLPMQQPFQPRRTTTCHGVLGAGERKTIFVAIGTNVVVLAAKVAVAKSSGSSSMVSASVHTLADIGNQVLLCVGLARSTLPPTAMYPYGFQRDKYIFSLISAVAVFCIGGGAAVMNGVGSMLAPGHHVGDLRGAFIVLGVSSLLSTYSGALAVQSIRRGARAADQDVWKYLESGAGPVAVAVIAEDVAAAVGGTLALGATWLVDVTGVQAWDGAGSVAVGATLGAVALFLIQRNRSILIGRSMDADTVGMITAFLNDDPVIASVSSVRTDEIAPGSYRFAADVSLDAAALIAASEWRVDAAEMPDPSTAEAQADAMAVYASALVAQVGIEIDRIEAEIRAIAPGVVYVDLEVDTVKPTPP